MKLTPLLLALVAFSPTARAEQGDAEDRALMDKIASETRVGATDSSKDKATQGTARQRESQLDKSDSLKTSQ